MVMRSAFDGTSMSLYLAAAFIFKRFRSSRVGFGISFNLSMISRRTKAVSVKVECTKIRFRKEVDKLN